MERHHSWCPNLLTFAPSNANMMFTTSVVIMTNLANTYECPHFPHLTNMTQIFPARSKNTGSKLERRVLARRLAPEFDERGPTCEAAITSGLDQKKGG